MKENIQKVHEKVKKVKIIDEFKTFISRGNVLDLAVGVIIGASFQNVVKSLTDNIISPILGCFSEVDFSEHFLKIGNLELKYGAFLTDIINFLIMAFVVFILVKMMNRILVKPKKEEVVEVKKTDETILLEEIRDLLKEKSKR